MPKGRAIDPMRVLRRHWKGIPVWAVVGAMIGTGAFFLFARVYPLYTGEYLFEVRPGLGEATDIGTVDMSNDKMVARIAATQTVLIRDRSILQKAVEDRNMRETDWIKQFNDPATGLPDYDLAVDDLEDAIELANSTRYGLSSGVVTNSLEAATRCVRGLRTGTVNVNEVPGYRTECSPFGGVKDSGLGIKEGVVEAIAGMTNVKTFSLPW